LQVLFVKSINERRQVQAQLQALLIIYLPLIVYTDRLWDIHCFQLLNTLHVIWLQS